MKFDGWGTIWATNHPCDRCESREKGSKYLVRGEQKDVVRQSLAMNTQRQEATNVLRGMSRVQWDTWDIKNMHATNARYLQTLMNNNATRQQQQQQMNMNMNQPPPPTPNPINVNINAMAPQQSPHMQQQLRIQHMRQQQLFQRHMMQRQRQFQQNNMKMNPNQNGVPMAPPLMNLAPSRM